MLAKHKYLTGRVSTGYIIGPRPSHEESFLCYFHGNDMSFVTKIWVFFFNAGIVDPNIIKYHAITWKKQHGIMVCLLVLIPVTK